MHTTEKILDTIHDLVGIGLFEYQADSDVFYISDSCRYIFDIEHDQEVGINEALQYLDEPFRTQFMAIRTSLKAHSAQHFTTQSLTTECSITTQKGQKRWLRIYRKHLAENGQIVSRGFVQDISSEIEQRVTAQQFKDLYDNAPYGYHTTTLDGLITNMNATMRHYLGYSDEEINDHLRIENILTPESFTKRKDLRTQLMEVHELRDMELDFVRKNGTVFSGLVNVLLVRDDLGEPIAIRAATVDLSERKQLEQVQRKVEAAEEANRLKSEFLNMLSHEFRTPLGVVIGVADALQSHVDEVGKQYIAMLEASGNRLLTMLNNVLELVKTEFDIQGLTPFQPTDIQHFCSQLQQEWKVRMEERGIEFLLEISPNIPQIIFVDKLRLERILHSLIENATRFTENGFIRLVLNCSVSPNNTMANLHVRLQDTGIGIPADQINKVFEPFYQAHHGITRDYDGAGIGLTVVRTLVKQIKGTVQISSVVGSGTTVVLNVPIAFTQ